MNQLHESQESLQYLTFFIGDEEYGLPILRVREIIRYAQPSCVPLMPQAVRGVINLRGLVVPVLDFSVKFAMTARPVSKFTCIVIVDVDVAGEPIRMGIIADSVNQVVEIPPEDVEETPRLSTKSNLAYLKGLGRMDGRFFLILDVNRLMSEDGESALTLGDTAPGAAREGAMDAALR